MAAIRNILFDYGNVLWNLDIPGAYEKLNTFWNDDMDSGKLKVFISKTIDPYEKGLISSEKFIKNLLQVSKPCVQALDLVQTWNGMLLDLPKEKIDLLQRLRPHFKLFMLSNTNELHISYTHAYLKENFNIDRFEKDFFNTVYYSHLIKARKPNNEAFKYVLSDAGILPQETLFIDDLAVNTRAANQLGFQIHTLLPSENLGQIIIEKTNRTKI